MLVITDKENARKEIEEVIIELESEIKKSIQPTIRSKSELLKTDSGLLKNIFSEGQILFSREPLELPASALLNKKPFRIYIFSLAGLKQKEKSQFNRRIYGQKKAGYKYKGFLEELGGEKLSRGCFIIPFNQIKAMEKFFEKYCVSYHKIDVWK